MFHTKFYNVLQYVALFCVKYKLKCGVAHLCDMVIFTSQNIEVVNDGEL